MFPSIRAVNDHPCMSRLVRLGVRCDHGRAILLFGDSLSSTDSATAVAALFARVDGTMEPSDFPSAYMSAVPPEAFADRSNSEELETVGISRFSRLKFSDMPGSTTPPCRHITCHIAMRRVAFRFAQRRRHTEKGISELNGWPACTSYRCYTHDVTVVSVRLKAGVTG